MISWWFVKKMQLAVLHGQSLLCKALFQQPDSIFVDHGSGSWQGRESAQRSIERPGEKNFRKSNGAQVTWWMSCSGPPGGAFRRASPLPETCGMCRDCDLCSLCTEGSPHGDEAVARAVPGEQDTIHHGKMQERISGGFPKVVGKNEVSLQSRIWKANSEMNFEIHFVFC